MSKPKSGSRSRSRSPRTRPVRSVRGVRSTAKRPDGPPARRIILVNGQKPSQNGGKKGTRKIRKHKRRTHRVRR